MEDALDPTATWLGAAPDAIPVLDQASVSLVRDRVREQGARTGLDDVTTARLVNVASELAHNQLAHAMHGRVLVREAVRGTARGVEIVAADRGAGIVDVRSALEGRARVHGSLGVGVAAVCELADEVDLDVRLGEGTCVWARAFPPGSAHTRRRRVGVYGRSYPGERRSGDDAVFVRTADALVVALADGLGHGDPAREASTPAVRLAAARASDRPEAILAAVDSALARTRGAVMTVASVGDAGEVALSGVGNVTAYAHGFDNSWRFGGSSSFLGDSRMRHRAASETRRLDPQSVLVLFTDGVRSRIDLSGDLALLREHPVLVAQQVVERFGRDDDDVLVVVVG